MEGYISETVALFRQMALFQGLDDAQLAEIETFFKRYKVQKGDQIVQEGSPGDYFYIIFSGRFLVWHETPTGREEVATLIRGDYFGEEALLFGQPRLASVSALEDSELLLADAEKFEQMLALYPSLRVSFTATAESRRLAEKEHFDWLGKDEAIYLVTRKHELFLWRSLILPIFLVILGIPIAVWGMMMTSVFLQHVLLVSGGVLIGGGILWGIWNWIDWGNDYYIITNQRVVWLENVIGIYSSRREAPLTTILAVNKLTTQIGRIFNYGTIDVRTFTGSIVMRNMANPDLFEAFLRGHRERAQKRTLEQERQSMREALRTRLLMQAGGKTPVGNSSSPKPSLPVRAAPLLAQDRNKAFKEMIKTFFMMRYESQGVITYRKHWLVLVHKTLQPTCALLALIAFTAYLIYRLGFQNQGFLLSGLTWTLLLFLGYVGVGLWWLYHYLDWSNDIYQLTPEQILDIEKKPLGREDKKTASLDSILSVEHDRRGILRLLFNYGDVIVNVGQTQFTFDGVANPDQVHQDIRAHMEARARKKRERELAQERERMMEWLSVYHEEEKNLSKGARELEG
ncbi:MAG: hypothetical protein DDG59_01600 [Anaerolineae bacterium]|jgi:uncharacterized membrane protein YdbT with pleckstrin-like domain|nr:MAG: hypothetical protein DDG59_01600 [Anaerolineae bacterium]